MMSRINIDIIGDLIAEKFLVSIAMILVHSFACVKSYFAAVFYGTAGVI